MELEKFMDLYKRIATGDNFWDREVSDIVTRLYERCHSTGQDLNLTQAEAVLSACNDLTYIRRNRH